MLTWLGVLTSSSNTSAQAQVCSDEIGQPSFGSTADLPSASGRVSGHWLLLPEGCDEAVSEAGRSSLIPRRVARATGELARQLLLADDSSCSTAVCLGHGLDLELVAAGAQRPDHGQVDLASWAETACQPKHVGFVILDDKLSRLRWLDKKTRRPASVPADAWRVDKLMRPHREVDSVMARPAEYWFIARLGDRFEVTRGDEVLIQGSVDYDGVHVVGSLSPEDPAQRVSYVRDYWALLNMTAKVEQRRARVVKKKYTPTGSHVTDVPPAVWASVSTYYFNNAHAGFPEGWLETAEHVNVNFWDSRPDIIAVPARVKREWQAGLMAGVSDWGGGVDLEPTALYGMRVYKEGAFLNPHVDREETHALSLVMNIAQGGVREPWPLEVDDMEGTTHEAVLAPGQMVYYESARCLHGRTKLFKGDFFVNFFAHYRPKGDPDWYHDKKRGDPKKFKLVNDGAGELSFSWVGPSGLVPIDTVEPGGARDMGTKVGDVFKLSGACHGELRVDAHTGGPERLLRVCGRGWSTNAGITVRNEASVVAELWWLGPGEPTLIQGIDAHASINVNAKLYDKFVVRGACNETIRVTSPDEVFNVCLSAMAADAFRLQTESAVKRFTRIRPVLIRNLCARDITLWFQDSPRSRGTLTAHIAPNSYSNLGTYPGSVFCVVDKDDDRGCQAARARLTLFPDKEYRYDYDDGSGDPSWREAYQRERDHCTQHKMRTGREWLADWQRPAPGLPIHSADHIGQELVVRTSSPPLTNGAFVPDAPGTLTLRAVSTSPAAFEIQTFLSDEEADHLIELGQGQMKRSTVQSSTSNVRTSRNAWLRRGASSITERISRRATDVLGVEEHVMWEDNQGGHAESMQLVHYSPGQQYEAHYDWQANAKGARFATLLLYLNTPSEGGWTAFPQAKTPEPLLVEPKKGTALLFYNMLPDGNADALSVHAALPTRVGEKWLANLWVWDSPLSTARG